jgi:ADP-heptose:LPS heptosyltransferase
VHPRDAARSVAIAKLATLLLDERYDWVALQHGDKYAQGYQVGPRLIHNLGKQVADFADTAAILSQLDLLISIDSAPVHLAGALGVPCWVMLDAAPDWRWGLQGETTPWYPSLRLFRQEKAGDWGVVVGRLARELETFTSQGMHVG